MMRTACSLATLIALFFSAVPACFAQEVRSGTLVPGQAVSNPAGVVVVQNNGAGGPCRKCPGPKPGTGPTPPVPAPLPPIPPGFVVVQSNYLEQVAATAKSAIDSAKANEESLVGIMKVAGWLLGVLAIVLTYFGFKEYASIQAIKQKLKKNLAASKAKLEEVEHIKGEVVSKLELSVWQMQELTSVLLDMHQLSLKISEVENLLEKNNATEMKRVAEGALRAGKLLFERANKLRATRNAPSLDAEKVQSDALERIVSYIVATLSVFSMRFGQLDEAVEWARQSVQHNPMNYDDREYNYACALAKRYEQNHAIADSEAALEILRRRMDAGDWTWREIWGDDDFKSIRADLEHSPHADSTLLLKEDPAEKD